jgi:ATP-dependent Clp protease ATP-binding subunit ClpX
VQIDTSGILFICGGTFSGLEDIVRRRISHQSMGFGAKMTRAKDKSLAELLSSVEPDDLKKYGLIPEFIGRLPVVACLDPLEEEALIRILTEPRNALVRQYQKLLTHDGVELAFTDGALVAIAREAMKRGTGARALRTIIEETMLDVMYDIPSREGVRSVTVTEECITSAQAPTLAFESQDDEERKKTA